jgi:hypothetical protein
VTRDNETARIEAQLDRHRVQRAQVRVEGELCPFLVLRAPEAEQVGDDQLTVTRQRVERGAERVAEGGQPVQQHDRGLAVACRAHAQRPGTAIAARRRAPPAHRWCRRVPHPPGRTESDSTGAGKASPVHRRYRATSVPLC